MFKFKPANKNVNFPNQFCLGSISNGFSVTESREVSLIIILISNMFDYNSIDKSEILNNRKYLINKSNMK